MLGGCTDSSVETVSTAETISLSADAFMRSRGNGLLKAPKKSIAQWGFPAGIITLVVWHDFCFFFYKA